MIKTLEVGSLAKGMGEDCSKKKCLIFLNVIAQLGANGGGMI